MGGAGAAYSPAVRMRPSHPGLISCCVPWEAVLMGQVGGSPGQLAQGWSLCWYVGRELTDRSFLSLSLYANYIFKKY